jgi:hypothetical protein
MTDKDKEEFEKWLNKERRIFEATEPATFCDSDEACMKEGWQAACEYQQKEITLLENEISYLEETIADFMDEPDVAIKRLQAENKKLREALNNWIQWENGQIVMNGEYTGEDITRLIREAKEALKEVGEE